AIEHFVHGLGLLLAGHDAALDDCATSELVVRLRSALEPFHASGEVLRPDFGAYGELRVDGDLLDAATPVAAWLSFDDRSMRQLPDGRLQAVPRQRVCLSLTVTLHPCRIVDCAVFLEQMA
ncbi:MAG: hypothetical protein JOY80_02060, partial [Candidatus Dormibacteraeota bacterium]|nr:hypothetical protein [Candidatus Dormibacteraeota bacterium]